jgi:transcriptional repressor NrdR
MRCPFCGCEDTQVKDSRPAEEGSATRRRRLCPQCDQRFTTFERVHLRELIIVKKSGRRVPFDRDKLARSVEIALRKRPVDPERIDTLVNDIQRKLEGLGETDIPSHTVGEFVMVELAGLDTVAFVRYASVYRDFQKIGDFENFLGEHKLRDLP